LASKLIAHAPAPDFVAPQFVTPVDKPPAVINGCLRSSSHAHTVYFDGEIAVLIPEGISDFGALQEALGGHGGSADLTYIAFDLLHLDGRDLRAMPLIERKGILEKLLAKLPNGSPVHFSHDIAGQGPEFFKAPRQRHLEGIISKRATSPTAPAEVAIG
jgi:ATP-dependent DNA ligase